MTMVSAQDVDRLVQGELGRISEPALVNAIAPFLVTPRLEDRAWDYGSPDQTYPCWIVLEHPPSKTGIAYCAEGFGPANPWGLLFLSGQHLSTGMDSGWYMTLEDAFRQSMACSLPPPAGYEVA
jgi:hypothetical protein